MPYHYIERPGDEVQLEKIDLQSAVKLVPSQAKPSHEYYGCGAQAMETPKVVEGIELPSSLEASEERKKPIEKYSPQCGYQSQRYMEDEEEDDEEDEPQRGGGCSKMIWVILLLALIAIAVGAWMSQNGSSSSSTSSESDFELREYMPARFGFRF